MKLAFDHLASDFRVFSPAVGLFPRFDAILVYFSSFWTASADFGDSRLGELKRAPYA